jgi:putative membrane protein
VAALAAELVLLRGELSATRARQLLRLDAIYGTSAMVLVGVGLLRVFFFEKGAAFYFHNAAFIAKLSLFAAVGLISIYPTVQFMKWRPALRQGQAPVMAEETRRRVRMLVHLELTGVVLILLCAALMAKGIGHF